MASYTLAHAICDGYIDSVDTRLDDWPLLENTLYYNQKLSDILNMNSGDHKYIEKGEFINIIKESVDEVTGLDAALTTTGGTSDARFFKDYCEVAEFGLIGETAHQVDENVKIADIENLEKIYYSILKKYFHKN